MDEFHEAKKIVVNRTFSITHGHSKMVARLADELTAREDKIVYESEVIRKAIELMWSAVYGETQGK
jgi:hypothetical protein